MLFIIPDRIQDPEDDDWACAEDFTPGEGYLHLTGTSVRDMAWNDLLGNLKEIITSYISSTNFDKSILKNAVAITVGFDDGELITIPIS